MPVSGVIDSPGADGSRTYTASVPAVRAGTRITSATCAHGTNCLMPLRTTLPPRDGGAAGTAPGLQPGGERGHAAALWAGAGGAGQGQGGHAAGAGRTGG